MRWLFVSLVWVHGAIHLLGFAKAFGLAELPQLAEPVSRPMGVVWLAAAFALFATGALCLRGRPGWWAIGLVAVVISQLVVLSAWSDAQFGTAANLLVLGGVVYGFAAVGPMSLRAEYRSAVKQRIGTADPLVPVTDADLEPLPEPVRRYLRLVGVVGRPRVRHFRAEWRGRIRSGPDDPWMTFAAEQYNVPGEPARLFFMDAVRGGLPVDVFHEFRDGRATMRVRVLSLVQVANARGPEMTRAETVTLFNDLALLAPAALLDPAIRWEPIDDRSVRGTYAVGSNEVSAVLHFNVAGELVDFVSDDRLAASTDGTEFTQQRWSTPVGGYRSFGPFRLMSRGTGWWHPPGGAFPYFEGELTDLEVNGPIRRTR